VCARHRQWKTAGLVLGVGLVAGASLAPYVPSIIESQSWWLLEKMDFDFARIWRMMTIAGGSLVVWPFGAWLGLIPLALGAGLAALRQQAKSAGIGREDLPLYGASALVAGIASFLVFIRISELPTQPWYFLPLLVFVASAMDAALANWCRRFRVSSRLFVAFMVGLLFIPTLQSACFRQTNIDLIAAELQDHAEPGDFIVICPWHCGITFERYYKGRTPWTTLPALGDHRFHRYDLVKEKMREISPVKPVLERAGQTLASGHTLWLIMQALDATPPQTEPPDLPSAPFPNVPRAWWEGYYTHEWKQQLEYLVASRAGQVENFLIKPGIKVNRYEKLSLLRASGWHEKNGGQPTPAASP
jgi:hypothetical protein